MAGVTFQEADMRSSGKMVQEHDIARLNAVVYNVTEMAP